MANAIMRIKEQSGYLLYLVVIVLLAACAYVITIFTSQRLTGHQPRIMMRKLQAKVLAFSGLDIARAFVDGYDGHEITWETEEFRKELPGAGKILLSAKHAGGWLNVASTGITTTDNVTMLAVLGQQPPQFAKNTINLAKADNGLTIGDRARVNGTVALAGGMVKTLRSGKFAGSSTRFKQCDFNPAVIEDEIESALGIFIRAEKSNSSEDSLPVCDSTDFRHKIIAARDGAYMKGDFKQACDTIDLRGKKLWVPGKFAMSGNAVLTNGIVYVRQTATIADSASISHSTLVVFKNFAAGGKTRLRATICCADTLLLQDNARALYPSFLYISPVLEDYGVLGQRLIMQDHARIDGTIATGVFSERNGGPKVLLLSGSTVNGLIYSPAEITPAGSISGSLYAWNTAYSRPEGEYSAFIIESSIADKDLSRMTVPLLFPNMSLPECLTISCEGRE